MQMNWKLHEDWSTWWKFGLQVGAPQEIYLLLQSILISQFYMQLIFNKKSFPLVHVFKFAGWYQQIGFVELDKKSVSLNGTRNEFRGC